MMEEDLQGSSQVKEETDTAEQKPEPMEVDEKKPEVKVEAKEEEESSTNGASSQSTSPSQPRKKSRLFSLNCWTVLPSIALNFHIKDWELEQENNSMSPFIFLPAVP